MTCPCDCHARCIENSVQEMLRQRAVHAVQSGISVSCVAQAYGVSARTVFRWLAAYALDGPQALRNRPIPGRPKRRNRDSAGSNGATP